MCIIFKAIGMALVAYSFEFKGPKLQTFYFASRWHRRIAYAFVYSNAELKFHLEWL
jgi:hypothetical protein